MLEPLKTLPDGTIKQVSPFNGTQVWTVPGRAFRPYVNRELVDEPLEVQAAGRYCSFCEQRYLDSPPERTRLVGEQFEPVHHVPAARLAATVAEFRRVGNLFPILPLAYWHANHGFRLSDEALAWRADYLADATGTGHLLALAQRLHSAAGFTPEEFDRMEPEQKLAVCDTFFASSHDLVIARRHYTGGATRTAQLAGSGEHTAAEHAAYLRLTVEAAHDLMRVIPMARYVTIFQNWLRPAGASFDHLHKQLAAIDQIPVQVQRELERQRQVPDLYRRFGVDYAEAQGLVVASNEHAVAFAGYGHRYPTLEVHSLSEAGRPWELGDAELRGLSDMVHAMHVASGTTTPANEEWHYQPPGISIPSPVRVVVKWRSNTLAGFEGATKIYLTTLSPWALREQAVLTLQANRERLGAVTVH